MNRQRNGETSSKLALRISLTMAGEKASNTVVVHFSPSREEQLLSDHVFHLFGRTITITGKEEFLAIVVLVVAVTAWAFQQFRWRRAFLLWRGLLRDHLGSVRMRVADYLCIYSYSTY